MEEETIESSNTPPFIKQLGRDLPLKKYPCLIALCSMKNDDGSDNLILKALAFAYEHHAGQVRKSGEPYIIHPIAVAEIIADTMGLQDPELIAASLLHDIVEDVSSLTTGSIEKRFGENVAKFVDGCTKLKMMSLGQSLNKDMTYKKLISMASESPEILLIKIADRIHNMRTIGFLKLHKRQRIAHETLEVYAPLAEKLGLFSIKRMLFEMSLKHSFPKKSKKLSAKLKAVGLSDEVTEIKAKLLSVCSPLPYSVKVKERLKNLYAFYNDKKRTLDFDDAENLVDFTVVLDSEEEQNCYQALGLINALGRTNPYFSTVPKSIRDYIANPKINSYKSLHVRLTYKEKRYLVKIRTAYMERIARQGVLLHWEDHEKIREYRNTLKEILQSIGEYEGSPTSRKDLIRQLIEDDKVFVYTPRGDIHYLPEGSIVLDFAYKVHTTLGDHCRYALVNNKKVSSAHVLADGDEVKIFTYSHSSEITSDLEEKCKTPKARSALNKKLQKKRDLYAEKIGRNIMAQALGDHGFQEELFNSNAMADFLTYKGFESLERFFTSIGQFRVMPGELLWELAEIHPAIRQSPRPITTNGYIKRFVLTLAEIERDVHKFSQCCKPLPGMGPCVGVLSVNGVSIHRSHCEKYKESRGYSHEKTVDIKWDNETRWQKSLLFHLNIQRLTVERSIQVLADVQPLPRLHGMTPMKRGFGTALQVVFHNFEQARQLFSAFEKADVTVEIEEYGKML